ncbi:AMP-binding protein [Mangrovihabitans endophyticus]|uniref:AMP-dependent synthetase/ligase domain-containing protein n=1 Tax=Mangrovihabitans endophyticus TaxID=1751298 RepID=A0A8J3BTR4_9ACTN|nr:AMP-binding protein [Mangrovihabitans endophyticus]GGK73790.1 hypothetical protein GCM10012284_04620 [Mangrovihabitans endophyticus]
MTVPREKPQGDAEVGFHTSGHTGKPTLWLRTHDQLRTEAQMIGDVIIGTVDRVVTFAPAEHLFGRLFGDVLPRLRGIPVQDLHTDPTQAPDLIKTARTLLVCLPSTWAVLQRMIPRLRELPGTVALHGTGPVTPAAARVVSQLRGSGFRAVELFGSTESGGIAYREMSTDPAQARPWRLLPDVRLVTDGPASELQTLHVRSPRLARPANAPTPPPSLRLPDLIRPVDARHFDHVGRSTGLVKVNGRRCDIDAVAADASRVLGTEVACLAMRDPLRGEHYELYYDDLAGTLTDETVWHRLPGALAGRPVPRTLHAVPGIPRTATGKLKLDQLHAATAQRSAVRA